MFVNEGRSLFVVAMNVSEQIKVNYQTARLSSYTHQQCSEFVVLSGGWIEDVFRFCQGNYFILKTSESNPLRVPIKVRVILEIFTMVISS